MIYGGERAEALDDAAQGEGGHAPRVSRGGAQFGTGSRRNQGLEERHMRHHRLRVPLHADDEAVALDALDRAVCRACRRPAGPRRPGRPPGGGRSSRASVRVRTMRCSRECAAISTSCVASVAGSVCRWPGTCWCSVPPQATLSAWLPRQIARIGRLRISAIRDEAQLEGVQARLGRPELHVALVGAVGRRVQVRAARQADAVEAIDQRREVVGADGRQHHRDRAGGVERAQIRHPQRHLGVGGLAVAARGREAAGPQFRGGDANEGAHAHIIGSACDIPHPPLVQAFATRIRQTVGF